ncbi:MAG: ABC transporter ATP-binding protein [Ruminococcus sp.]|nr:ABC transporter ATP-binding protein [Ruminococcus sp.]
MLKKLFALSDKGAKDLKDGILACAFYNLCTMIPVVILVKIISELLKAVETGEILLQEKKAFYLIATVILFLLIFISQWIQYQKTYTVAYAESKNRRFVLAEKLRRLPLSFFGNKNIADLTTTIMGDCTALEKTFSNAIPTLFGTVLTFCLISVGLLITDWRMGLCILFPVPLAGLVLLMAKKSQQKAESDNLEAKRSAYDGVQEYLDTISELKSSCLTEDYLSGLEKKLDTVVQCSFRNEVVPGSALTAAQFILRFGLVAVLLVGGILVGKGTLSVVMFLMFILVAGRIYDPFSSCFMMLAEIFSAMVSVNRMKEMESETEQTGDSAFNPQGYDITFKDVHFAYDKDEKEILSGISFTAKEGEVTALAGPSGSGKSTVSKLAARFWDADSGQILIGGVDIRTVEPEALLKKFSVVFQDVLLFDESVMENIRLGRKDATDEEVLAAARAAQCEEFVAKLPQGYQTNIGENGSMLSGGQRQRISIARALLKDAPIVLLDEATASMDAESETLVQNALSVLLNHKTVLVIAHRLRTIANADKVIVLDNGKISEEGTPEELEQKNGLYQKLVTIQNA